MSRVRNSFLCLKIILAKRQMPWLPIEGIEALLIQKYDANFDEINKAFKLYERWNLENRPNSTIYLRKRLKQLHKVKDNYYGEMAKIGKEWVINPRYLDKDEEDQDQPLSLPIKTKVPRKKPLKIINKNLKAEENLELF